MSKVDHAPPLAQPGTAQSRGRWLRLAAVLVVMVGVLAIPPQPGLSAEGQRVLAIVAAAVVLWATEVVPVAVSSLIVIVLLVVMGGVQNPSEALAGFSSPILYFLLGSLAMGAAVMRSGLAERLAGQLVRRSRGSSKRLLGQLLMGMPLMAFAMPSAINRNAMLIPAYEHAFRSLSINRREPLAKSVMLVLGLLNPFASSALMTGGLAPMTTSTLLGGFTWFRWFLLMAVPYYVLLALGGILVYLLFRPPPSLNGEQAKGAPKAAEGTSYQEPGLPIPREKRPFTREEKLTMAVVSGASLLWLTDFIHHWNAAIPALMAAVILMLPGVGIFTWGQFEKSVGWSTFFVLGASLSLTQALISTGAASWFAEGLMKLFASGSPSPWLLAVFVILITTIVHLGIPNMSACIALLIPVVTAFANATGINPVAAGLIVGIVVDAVVLYPVQTATNLLAYEAGHFDGMDVLKVGMGMLGLTTAVVLLVAIPWWGLMGLPFS